MKTLKEEAATFFAALREGRKKRIKGGRKSS
jgi:hypothetical protein